MCRSINVRWLHKEKGKQINVMIGTAKYFIASDNVSISIKDRKHLSNNNKASLVYVEERQGVCPHGNSGRGANVHCRVSAHRLEGLAESTHCNGLYGCCLNVTECVREGRARWEVNPKAARMVEI